MTNHALRAVRARKLELEPFVKEAAALEQTLAALNGKPSTNGSTTPCPYAAEKVLYRTCPRDLHGYEGPRCEDCPPALHWLDRNELRQLAVYVHLHTPSGTRRGNQWWRKAIGLDADGRKILRRPKELP